MPVHLGRDQLRLFIHENQTARGPAKSVASKLWVRIVALWSGSRYCPTADIEDDEIGRSAGHWLAREVTPAPDRCAPWRRHPAGFSSALVWPFCWNRSPAL